MLEQKTTLVSDFLHGPIALSPLEKKVISTQIFNRLHNILQNSTVYFTFPANRTSRFCHSLGCTKIAGEMFRNSLLNASKEVRNLFFRKAEKILYKLIGSQAFSDDARHIGTDTAGTNARTLQKFDSKDLDCVFYRSVCLPDLNQKETYLYTVFYQATRLAALLHDLGHPPFSHITEYALAGVHEFLHDKEQKTKLGKREKQIVTLLDKFFKSAFGSIAPSPKKAFHEVLGETLSEFLLRQISDEFLNSPGKEKLCHDVLLISHLTMDIFHESGPLQKALHKLIDSDLDADRLDYVQRDTVMSGFSAEPLRIGRLIQSYTLCTDDGTMDGELTFAPSARAIHNIEEFFSRRFNLYKYAIYHHRAIKFDILLQRCARNLAEKHLASGIKDGSNKSRKHGQDIILPNDISGLWAVLPPDVATNKYQCVNSYIQWDDAWLLGILRSHYFSIQAERSSPKSPKPPKAKGILEIQLEELLSNRKQYHALYKRGECFLEVDQVFALHFQTGFDWVGFERAILEPLNLSGKHQSRVERQLKLFKEHVDEVVAAIKQNAPIIQKKAIAGAESGPTRSAKIPSTGEADGKDLQIANAIEKNGFVLSRLFRMLNILIDHEHGQEFLALTEEKFKDKLKAVGSYTELDVLFAPKQIKKGVDNDMPVVDSDGKLVALGRVSRVADELDRASLLFPPFFVFIYAVSPSPNIDMTATRRILGEALIEAFVEVFKS